MKLLSHSNKRLFNFILFLSLISSVAIIFTSPGKCNEAEREILFIGKFSEGDIDAWEKKVFNNESQYRLTKLEGLTVLEANANQSASGLAKKIKVDLTQTPFLNWSWQVEKAHVPLKERTKQGDDYAARVYLVVDGGLFFWRTIALSYVWSSSQPAGRTWPNSYAGENVMHMALRTSSDHLSTWHREKRNVYEDFKKLFKKEILYIDAVAIMTDSDNSGGDVKAYYGDIYFSKD